MSRTPEPTNTRKAKSLPKPVTVLLTGFDAFGGDQHNPSEIVVESFPDVLKCKVRRGSKRAAEIHIRKQVLPTAGTSGWKTLKKTLDRTVRQAEGPVTVIMLGLAAARQSLSLERFALNFRDYSLADNDGEQRQEETIEPRSPVLLRSDLDLRQLQSTLKAAGYPCDISNHAGTFVCNELYFRALNYKRKFRNVDSVLFVHLPLEHVFAHSAQKAQNKQTPRALVKALEGLTETGKAGQFQLLQQAIAKVVESVARQIASCSAGKAIFPG